MPESKSPRDPESAAARRRQNSALGPQGRARRAPMSLVPEGQPEHRKPAGWPRVKVEDDCSPISAGCAVPRNRD